MPNNIKKLKAVHPYEIGKMYLIRTVTNTQVGRLTAVYDNELVLEDASWVADTGLFHDAFKNGTLEEVEPFNGCAIIGRGSISDVALWNHPLPTKPTR